MGQTRMIIIKKVHIKEEILHQLIQNNRSLKEEQVQTFIDKNNLLIHKIHN